MSVVGRKSLDVSPRNELLLLPMIIKNYIGLRTFLRDVNDVIARYLGYVHYRTGSPGQLGLRVAGFPGQWVAGSQNVTQFHFWLRLAGLSGTRVYLGGCRRWCGRPTV